MFSLAVDDHVDIADRRAREDVRHRLVGLDELPVHRVRERGVDSAATGVGRREAVDECVGPHLVGPGRPESNERVRIAHRQRPEQQPVHGREKGGVRADAKGQRDEDTAVQPFACSIMRAASRRSLNIAEITARRRCASILSGRRFGADGDRFDSLRLTRPFIGAAATPASTRRLATTGSRLPVPAITVTATADATSVAALRGGMPKTRSSSPRAAAHAPSTPKTIPMPARRRCLQARPADDDGRPGAECEPMPVSRSRTLTQ